MVETKSEHGRFVNRSFPASGSDRSTYPHRHFVQPRYREVQKRQAATTCAAGSKSLIASKTTPVSALVPLRMSRASWQTLEPRSASNWIVRLACPVFDAWSSANEGWPSWPALWLCWLRPFMTSGCSASYASLRFAVNAARSLGDRTLRPTSAARRRTRRQGRHESAGGAQCGPLNAHSNQNTQQLQVFIQGAQGQIQTQKKICA